VNIPVLLVLLLPLVLELTGALFRLLALDNTLLMLPIYAPRLNDRPKRSKL
jgi:hypothetical protein